MEDSLHSYEGYTPSENKEKSCLQAAGKKITKEQCKEKNTCMASECTVAMKISAPRCKTMQTPREQWPI